MELKLIAQDLAQTCKTTCDALVVLVPETFKPENFKGKASAPKLTSPQSVQDLIAQAMQCWRFRCQAGQDLAHLPSHTFPSHTLGVGGRG